jgi:hypothetical protein
MSYVRKSYPILAFKTSMHRGVTNLKNYLVQFQISHIDPETFGVPVAKHEIEIPSHPFQLYLIIDEPSLWMVFLRVVAVDMIQLATDAIEPDICTSWDRIAVQYDSFGRGNTLPELGEDGRIHAKAFQDTGLQIGHLFDSRVGHLLEKVLGICGDDSINLILELV